MYLRNALAFALAAIMPATALSGEKEIAAAIATIKSVSKEGQGNEAAATAWTGLVSEGIPALMPTLTGFKGANVYAANWLRSAVDAICEAEAKAGRKLPADILKAFFLNGVQSADARRIAFELFEKLQPDEAKRLIVGLIDDPSPELRRDAIARGMSEAKDDAALLAPLFNAARDRDQVEILAKKLNKPREDVVRHFNFITRWHIIGPFDGPKASGFETKYAPENGVDLNATYDGKDGAKIVWKAADAKDFVLEGEKEYCLIDLTKEIGKHKDAVAYGYAVIEVEKEMPVELRGASQNGVKFFHNGKIAFEREAYHQGTVMDQHAGKVILKPGRNEILYKICQNDQKEPWAQVWSFQMRICDSTGGPVPFKLISPEPK